MVWMTRRFDLLKENVEQTVYLFKYGASTITHWLIHMDELATTEKAKEMSKSFNPYKGVPDAPKEWLQYQRQMHAGPVSYEKEVRAMCLFIKRISPQTPMPPEFSPEKLPVADSTGEDGFCAADDEEEQPVSPQVSSLRSLRSAVRSNLRAQSAPTSRRTEWGSKGTTVTFIEDSCSSSTVGASTRPSSATALSTRPSSAAGGTARPSSAASWAGGSQRPSSSAGIGARPSSVSGAGRRRPVSAAGGGAPPRPPRIGGEIPSRRATDPIGRWDSLPPGPPECVPPPLPPLPHSLDHLEAHRAPRKEKGTLPTLPNTKKDLKPPPDENIISAVLKHRAKKAAFRKLLS